MISSLKALGDYAIKNPIRSATALGIGAYGTAKSIDAITHPIDTASSVGKFGLAVARNPSETGMYAGAAVSGLAVTAAAGYGINKFARTSAGKAIGRGVGKAANSVANVGGRAAEGITGGLAKRAVNQYAKAWESIGPTKMFPVAVGLGALYGGVKAVAKVGLNAPTYDSAMARSTEGSAYEQGPQAFGRRGQGSKLNTLGSSAMGLTQGLHNAR